MKASILIHLFRSDKIHRRKKNFRRKKFIWLIIQGQSLSPLEFKSDIQEANNIISRVKNKKKIYRTHGCLCRDGTACNGKALTYYF